MNWFSPGATAPGENQWMSLAMVHNRSGICPKISATITPKIYLMYIPYTPLPSPPSLLLFFLLSENDLEG